MTRKEKADDLFNRSCQHCEEFATKHKCEIQDTCPLYELYKMAKEKKHIIKPDEWQTIGWINKQYRYMLKEFNEEKEDKK